MTSDSSPVGPARTPRTPRRKLWWAAAAVLLIGAGFLTTGLLGHEDPLARPVSAVPHTSISASVHPSSTPTAQPSARSTTKPPTAKAVRLASPISGSAPVTLRIPAIGVSLTLSTLGLNPDGTVQVPVKDQAPGWFRLGPTPGQLGSAVILGHVDDYKGPAAFYKLRTLRPGDAVDVGLADGRVAHFAVRAVASYLKTQFPARKVYASHGYAALQLVTCGGRFDAGTGHYLSNVVAYSSLVSTSPAHAK